MPARSNVFTTIRTEGALLPADLLRHISEGADIDGLTPESYHYSGERLNEVISRAWNTLQGAWASFRAAQERLPQSDLGTSITRERWLLPLFRELDYGRLQTTTAVEIDGRSYPISHSWRHVPVHLVSYKLELDKRTPGAAGAASTSPHSLVQLFLNRSADSLWGFVSNGYKLRILRDNASLTRQAYIEFDLEAMMDGEVYSDFVLLWLLCHQSRVEAERPTDCWLERWMRLAQDQGTRALDQLRDGVERAIEALGAGFIDYPANAALRDKLTSGALSAQDYYRQLLRLVYRLLFLFVAEDRGLLLDPSAPSEARERYSRYYSAQRLRRMAETFKGTRHFDLFEGLRLVMRLLSSDAPPRSEEEAMKRSAATGLGLVPLGSFLFSDRAAADIIDCRISNQHLLDAVRALSLVYDDAAKVYRTVDYKNLGADELGSVFESLLELHPQINVAARTFALETAAGNERKTTGSYYTPEPLVHALLDSALQPVLDEAAEKGEQAILSLKICDPACGSGHFLIAAANRLAKALASIRTGEHEPPPAALQHAKRDVISRCLYGVDINPMAVELCKVNLWLEALEPGKPLAFLDHRILVGSSLLGTTPRLMAEGIPDDAFEPLEGDDREYAKKLRKRNKQERKERETGQHSMFDWIDSPADYARLTEAVQALAETPDDTLDALHRKEAQYAALASDPEYIKARLLADAWCAAFFWEKKPTASAGGESLPSLTDQLYRRLERDPLAESLRPIREHVVALADRCQFFHWHVAFPDVFIVIPPSTRSPLPQGEGRGGEGFPEGEGTGVRINPHTGWRGGFDLVLGNPPWERIKIQEKEWFAERSPDIARAPNAADRDRMIADLKKSNRWLYNQFLADLRRAEGESHFVRKSGRFPLTGRGDVNTYSLFAETMRHLIGARGRVGVIVPSGIATDDTTKFFFQDIVRSRALVSLYHFDNRERLFKDVGSSITFCLLTLRSGQSLSPDPDPSGKPSPRSPLSEGEGQRGEGGEEGAPKFAFFLHHPDELSDPERIFTLSAADIAQINPNTGTAPIFRSQRDADLTKRIYQRVPVLKREGEPEGNPWGIRFETMFHMSNDSHLFRTRAKLEDDDFALQGNHFVRGAERFLPLYEAKMMHQFTHRWATYAPKTVSPKPSRSKRRASSSPLPEGEGREGEGFPEGEGMGVRVTPEGEEREGEGFPAELEGEGLSTRKLTPDELRSPHTLPLPRYWVDAREVEERLGAWDRGWLLGFRDIARSTDERTAIFGLLPRAAVGNTMPLIFFSTFDDSAACFVAGFNTFAFDYNARQKIGGSHITYSYLKQLPVIPPHIYTPALLAFIVPRVLELTYTAWDMQPFARDLGYEGAPFVWDEERRFLIRCELDALYFHLYQIGRADVDYILETFPIVKRKDEAAWGEYRTKRVILELYDRMAALPPERERFGVGFTYAVPDVSQWVTQLDPPPADPRAAHPPSG